MADWLQQVTSSGSMLLAVPVALVAGLVSFFSPCVIPLLPGYLSYATGLSGADLAEAGRGDGAVPRGRMLAGATLFVLGFSVVFVGLGLLSGSVSLWFAERQRLLTVVLGCVVILLGLVFMGVLPIFQRDVRVHRVPAVGLAAAPVLGFLFAFGWIPCVGPTLAVILGLATVSDGGATRGGVLLACYSLGLGIPFVLAAVAWRRALGAVAWVRRHQAWVTRLGGAMLVAVGVLLLTGAWDHLVGWLQIHLVDEFSVSV